MYVYIVKSTFKVVHCITLHLLVYTCTLYMEKMCIAQKMCGVYSTHVHVHVFKAWAVEFVWESETLLECEEC